MTKLGDLSNDELLVRLRAHLGRGNVWLAGLLAYLGEVDDRRLYAEQACTSMWDFCVRKLGMSESEAQRRIAVARVLRAFPLARTYLEHGQVHLCALYEMHKHITRDNCEELLRAAAGKTTKAVGEMLAARYPKPDVHASVEPLTPQPALPAATAGPASPPHACSTRSPPPPEVRPRVEPLSATRYRIELTVSRETKEKLERIRDLMRHRNPSGDLEKIFALALDLLLPKLEKERFGKTSRSTSRTTGAPTTLASPTSAASPTAVATANSPTPAAKADSHTAAATADSPTPAATVDCHTAAATVRRNTQKMLSSPESEPNAPGVAKPARAKMTTRRRRIPRTTLREVCARDAEQCTFIDAEGNRCPARGFLELDHIKPKALGGGDEAANLRLRCRVHNRLHAERVFGRDYVEKRMHVRRRKSSPSSENANRVGFAPAFEMATRGLRSLGFREAEVREVMARLTTSLDGTVSAETVIRSALGLLT